MQFPQKLKQKQYQQPAEYAFVALSALAFLFYKFSNLTYRFSDHNLYFFYADRILHGQVPFRDFFMTDPALYDYILAGIKFITRSNVLFLQALPIFLHVAIALTLYALLKKWQQALALLTPAIYLFSFSTLANSDYATGEEWMILCLLLALLLWENKKSFWSGVLWSITCLIKLYAGAGLIGFVLFNLVHSDRKRVGKLILGGIPLALVWLGTFSIIAFHKFWYSLIGFHLNRPEGLSKLNIFDYFLQREWFLIIFGLAGLFLARKKPTLLIFAGLGIFFLIFKDLYYLYLQTLIPLLVLGSVILFSWVWQKQNNGKIYASAMIVAYLPFLIYSSTFYNQNWLPRGQFTNAQDVAAKVAALPDNFPLYGTYEATPLVSLLSHRDIFQNFYDTNPISFWNGRLDKIKISNDAVANGVYLVARISDYPEYGIKETGYEEYFDAAVFKQYCSRALVFPSTASEQDNYLIIYRCKK